MLAGEVTKARNGLRSREGGGIRQESRERCLGDAHPQPTQFLDVLVKPPKAKSVDRQAYSPEIINQLRDGQPTLRDQIGAQLLGRLGFRRNELRLIQLADFDVTRGTVRIHGKGGKIAIIPLGFKVLKRDLEVYLVGRGADEYLIYPKRDVTRPMGPSGIHYWFKRCLERAGLPATIKLHEMRHSAGDNLWRESGT